MAKKNAIYIRVNSDVKLEAEKILSRLGLSMSDAVSLFLNAVIVHRGIPFPIQLPSEDQEQT